MRQKANGFVPRHFITLWVVLSCSLGAANLHAEVLQFVYTSDPHYGITRSFRGTADTDAQVVNAAMVAKINALPQLSLPIDGGVNAGNPVGSIDYLIVTGDIANRMQPPVQTAGASFAQFTTDYLDGLTLRNSRQQKAGVLLSAGNHDVSNAIGYYKTMVPATDSSSMVGIYNLMMPSPRPAGPYSYANERIHYSRDIAGIHFMFVSIWPDSAERVWMAQDLRSVSASTPVILFSHDEPAVESKHFTNPNGSHTINSTDKFENLLLEVFKDGARTVSDPSTIEQQGFAAFVKANPNIAAYFHGNNNENKYYVYTGPDSTIALNTFQVDSPMKGNVSGSDETMLSFQLVSIDTDSRRMTVRECLWNAGAAVIFGQTKTVFLGAPQPTAVTEATGAIVAGYRLEQNYPNPFNPTTTISYSLPQRSAVSLTVYNLLGQQVAALVRGVQDAGFHQVKLDGSGLTSGIYLYTIRAGSFVETRKLLLLQ